MALLEIQTNTSVFYTIPHISWTAYEDALWTVIKNKLDNEQMIMNSSIILSQKSSAYCIKVIIHLL